MSEFERKNVKKEKWKEIMDEKGEGVRKSEGRTEKGEEKKKREKINLKSIRFDFAGQKIAIKVSIFTHFQYFRYHPTPPEVVFFFSPYVTPEVLQRRNQDLAVQFIRKVQAFFRPHGMQLDYPPLPTGGKQKL